MASDAGGIRAGRAYVELLLAGGEKFRAGLDHAERRLKMLGRAVSEIGRTVAAGGALMAAPFALALKIFDSAGEHLREFQRQAAIAGVGIDNKDLRAAYDFAQALKSLTVSAKVLAIQVASALAPAIKETFAWVQRMLQGIGLWVRANPELVGWLFKTALGVTAAGAALVALGHAMRTASAVLKLVSFGLSAVASLLAGALSAGLAVAQALWWGAGLAVSAFNAALAIGRAVLSLHTLSTWAATAASVGLQAAWGAGALVGWVLNAALAAGRAALGIYALASWAAAGAAAALQAAWGAAALVAWVLNSAGAAAAAMFVGYSASAWLANAATAVGGFVMHAWAIATGIATVATAVFNVVVDVLTGGVWALVTAAAAVIAVVGLVALGFVLAGAAAAAFASAGTSLVAWIGGAFTSMLGMASDTLGNLTATFKQAWGGIQKAIEAGDLQGAANVAWAGVKYAVLSNTVGLQKSWVDFTTDVQEGWADVVAAVSKGWLTVRAYGGEAIDTLAALWDWFTKGFVRAWHWAIDAATKLLAPLVAAAAAIGVKGAGIAQRALGAAAEPALGGVEADRQAEIDRLEKQRLDRKAQVDQGVKDAQKNLDDAVGALRNKGGGADTDPNPLALKSDVHGTFSAAAVGVLGSTKVNEMTDLIRDGNRKLDRINRTLEKSGKTS